MLRKHMTGLLVIIPLALGAGCPGCPLIPDLDPMPEPDPDPPLPIEQRWARLDDALDALEDACQPPEPTFYLEMEGGTIPARFVPPVPQDWDVYALGPLGATLVEQLRAGWRAGRADPLVTPDEAEMDACAEALEAVAGDACVHRQPNDTPLQSCDPQLLFNGTVPVGETCTSPLQCQDSTCVSDGALAEDCGTCVVLLDEGSRCDLDTECAAGLRCRSDLDDAPTCRDSGFVGDACPEYTCDLGNTCFEGTCTPLAKEGESCADVPCDPNLEVKLSCEDTDNGPRCQPVVRGEAVGDSCHPYAVAACGALGVTGLLCVPGPDDTGTCQAIALVELGAPCTDLTPEGAPKLCRGGLSTTYCDGSPVGTGLCTKRNGEGEPCTSAWGCADGTYCAEQDDQTLACEPLGAEGETCQNLYGCEAGLSCLWRPDGEPACQSFGTQIESFYADFCGY